MADALYYCSNELKLKEFSECSSLIKFIRIFDGLFDVLNSRNIFAKSQKAALRKSNIHVWKPILIEAREYIFGLKDNKGNSILKSKRKTGFLGFLCCIDSVFALFEKLVASVHSHFLMKYILTYKLSQDQLEHFFAAVRSYGKWNNNPNVAQFTSAYKRLLMRHHVETKGTCTNQDQTVCLPAKKIFFRQSRT